jgi:hypothetical protein
MRSLKAPLERKINAKQEGKILESRAIYQASCPSIGKVVFGSQSDSVTQECLCRCL